MHRVLILGCSGTGKSTLAVELGRRLGLPVVHLDTHFWQPGWVQVDPTLWPTKVAELLQGDRWVMDGNFLDSLELRLSAADTAIFLDRGRFTCLWRIFRRRLIYHRRTRPDLPENCPERFDWEFYKWVWRYPVDVRPEMLARLQAAPLAKRIVILQSDREATEFLAGLPTPTGPL